MHDDLRHDGAHLRTSDDGVATGEEVCICFHVPLNKIVKHVRLNDPQYASQLSECYGAGTGCGWCIPFLERIFESVKTNPQLLPDLGLSQEEYCARRREYHKRINADRMRDEKAGEGE
jgi:NAD(P)H-nitrite reductase large subunit